MKKQTNSLEIVKYVVVLCFTMTIAMLIVFSYKISTTAIRDVGYQYLMGLSLINSTKSINIELINQAHANMKYEENYNLLIKDAHDDAEEQIKNIDELMEYGIDILVIHPINDYRITQKIKEVRQKIPVVVFNEERFKALADAYIGYDNDAAARIIADQVNKNPFSQRGVLLITAPDNFYWLNERKESFIEALKPELKSKLKIVECSGDRNEAETMMKYFLVSGEDVGVVVGLNDAMAHGAALGAEKLRASQINFYGINGYDGYGGGQELVNSNVITGSVAFESMYDAIVNTSKAIIDKAKYSSEIILNAYYIQ